MQLIVAATIFGLVTYLLYRRLIRATGLQGTVRVAAIVVLVSLSATTIVGAGSGNIFATSWARPIAWIGWTWAAVVFYLLLGLAVLGVLRLTRLLRPQWLPAASAVLVVVAVGAVGFGAVEATNLRVVSAEIVDPDLPPEFDGLEIAVVSDLHVGPSRGVGLTQDVVEMVNEQEPDLVVLPGDLTDGTVERVGADLDPLAQLRAPLGIYGVAGNHESYQDDVGAWLDRWATLGVTPLRNGSVPISRGDATIDIAGVYDYSTDAPYAPDLDATLARRTGYTVLIAHQPRQVADAAERDVDLQLSGHTHGGQMWPFNYVVGWVNGTVSGPSERGGTALYTTVGVGTWGPPVRIGAPPEIVILTLRTGRG